MNISKQIIIIFIVLLGLLLVNNRSTTSALTEGLLCGNTSPSSSWTANALYSVSKQEFYDEKGEVLETRYQSEQSNLERVGTYTQAVAFAVPTGTVDRQTFTYQVFNLFHPGPASDTDTTKLIVEITYYDFRGSSTNLRVKELSRDLGRQRVSQGTIGLSVEQTVSTIENKENQSDKLMLLIDNDPDSYCPLGSTTVRFVITDLTPGEKAEGVFAIGSANQVLFNIGLEFQNDLDNGYLSEDLRKEFLDHEVSLDPISTTIYTVAPGSVWDVEDVFQNKVLYHIRKERDKLNAYAPRASFRISTIMAYECEGDGDDCIWPRETNVPHPATSDNCIAIDTGVLKENVQRGANLHFTAVPTDYIYREVYLRNFLERNTPSGWSATKSSVDSARFEFSNGTSIDLPNNCKQVVPQNELGSMWAVLKLTGTFKKVNIHGQTIEEKPFEKIERRWEWKVVEPLQAPKLRALMIPIMKADITPMLELLLLGPIPLKGDLDGDGDVDYDDYLIFRTAYGSCSGDDNFIPTADLDGDTCVTINDYRILRTLITP